MLSLTFLGRRSALKSNADGAEVTRLRAALAEQQASHAAYRRIVEVQVDQFLGEIDRLGERVLSLMGANDQLQAKNETLQEQHAVLEG